MTTSGTVGNTVITVQQLIDHGARRAGKLAEELTSEQVLASKESLWYLLSNLVNRGIQYWCIDKTVIGLNADQYIYSLPVGTVDILNSNYRTVTRVTTSGFSSSGVTNSAYDSNLSTSCDLSSNTGYIGINNGTDNPVYIATVGILPSVSGSVTMQIQYSEDGITYTTLKTDTSTWVAGTWMYFDLDPSATAQYWRILQTSGVNMGFTELVWGTAPMEIPLARLNRDDYTNLPNKNFTSNRPLQYWFNRTIPQPEMYLWPVPSDPYPQLVVWRHRQIQDVGDLSGTIEIPQRWYLAIQNMLAHQMAMELPAVAPDRIMYCEQQADKFWGMAEQEERDKSPMFFAPNISYYTR